MTHSPRPSATAGLALALGLLLSATLPGCAGTGNGDLALRDDGDRLLRAGNYEQAARAYERRLSAEPDSEELRENLRNAHELAARARAGQAVRALDRNEPDAAAAHLAIADSFAGYLGVVKRAHELIDPRIASAEAARKLRSEAQDCFDMAPERARDLLALAREKDPTNASITLLLQQATLRAEAERGTRKAAAAWSAGDREGVVDGLLDARYRGNLVPSARTVRERIERSLRAELHPDEPDRARADWEFAVRIGATSDTLRVVREAATLRLREAAAKLLSEGRPATAAVLEVSAQRMGDDSATPALDAVRSTSTVRLSVLPFEDATGGEIDGRRVSRAIAARIADDVRGGGVAITVTGPGEPPIEGALRLAGRAVSRRVGRDDVGSTEETVSVRVGTRSEPAPGMEELGARLQEAQTAVRDADEELRKARDDYRTVDEMPFIEPWRGGRSRIGEVYYARLLAKSEQRVREAEYAAKQARAAELSVRETVRSVVGHVEVPILEERTRTVRQIQCSAEITVELRLTDDEGPLLEQSVTGSTRWRETVAPGFPDGGVPADLDESPDDTTLVTRAEANLAGLVSGMVRSRAEVAARRYLVRAREAEAAGRKNEAAEAYAVYLLCTAEGATPDRAAAAHAFEDLTGHRVPFVTGDKEAGR